MAFKGRNLGEGAKYQSNASSKWLLILGSTNMFWRWRWGPSGRTPSRPACRLIDGGVSHRQPVPLLPALGLFAVAVAAAWFRPSRLFSLSGAFILAGLILFSGSLYVLSLTGQRWIGMITPFGGTAFMIGWLLLAAGVWRGRKP